MKVQFLLVWLALLSIPAGIYLDSDYFIWTSIGISAILVIKTAFIRCKKCGERVHLYTAGGPLGRAKIGLPVGHCGHCGKSYLSE